MMGVKRLVAAAVVLGSRGIVALKLKTMAALGRALIVEFGISF